MSCARNRVGIVVPALLGVGLQACATAEDVDPVTRQLIQDGALAGAGTTTTPVGNTPPPVTPGTTTPGPSGMPSTTAPATSQPVPSGMPQATPSQMTSGVGAVPGGVGGGAGLPPMQFNAGDPAAGDAPLAGEGMAVPELASSPHLAWAIQQATNVELRYRTAAADDGRIAFTFQIENRHADTLPMDELTVRYWYTSEGHPCTYGDDYIGDEAQPIGVTCGVTADGLEYVEFSYSAFELAGGEAATATDVELPFAAENPHFVQTDDYSYNPNARFEAPYDKMTVYRRGVLVAGTEPTP